MNLLSRRQALALGGLALLAGSSIAGSIRPPAPGPFPVPPSTPPPGFRFLDSRRLGVRVAIPEELDGIDFAAQFHEAEFRIFEELAHRAEADVDAYVEDQLSSIDAMAVDDDGTTVNIMRISSDHVPTAEELAPSVAQLAMTGIEFSTVTTAFGAGTSLRSATPIMDGAVTVHGHILWACSDKGVFSVQVTSGDPIIANAVYEVVLRTVQAA